MKKVVLASHWWQWTVWSCIRHCIHSMLSCQSSSPSTKIKVIMLRSKSVKLLTQGNCQKILLPFPTGLPMSGMTDKCLSLWSNTVRKSETNDTLCSKGKQLQRKTKINSIGSVAATFKTAPIHTPSWMFTHTFFLIDMPSHTCHCVMQDLTVLFYSIWFFCYLHGLWNYIWKLYINTSCFSHLETFLNILY